MKFQKKELQIEISNLAKLWARRVLANRLNDIDIGSNDEWYQEPLAAIRIIWIWIWANWSRPMAGELIGDDISVTQIANLNFDVWRHRLTSDTKSHNPPLLACPLSGDISHFSRRWQCSTGVDQGDSRR